MSIPLSSIEANVIKNKIKSINSPTYYHQFKFKLLVLIRIERPSGLRFPGRVRREPRPMPSPSPTLVSLKDPGGSSSLILTLESPVCSAVPETALLTAIPAFTSH